MKTTPLEERYTKALFELVGCLNSTTSTPIDVVAFRDTYKVGPLFFDALRDLECIVLVPPFEADRFTRTGKLLTITPIEVLQQEKRAKNKKPGIQFFTPQDELPVVTFPLEAAFEVRETKPVTTTMLDRALNNAEVPTTIGNGKIATVLNGPVDPLLVGSGVDDGFKANGSASVESVLESAKAAIDATTFSGPIKSTEFMCRCEQVPVRLCQEHGCLQAQNIASNSRVPHVADENPIKAEKRREFLEHRDALKLRKANAAKHYPAVPTFERPDEAIMHCVNVILAQTDGDPEECGWMIGRVIETVAIDMERIAIDLNSKATELKQQADKYTQLSKQYLGV